MQHHMDWTGLIWLFILLGALIFVAALIMPKWSELQNAQANIAAQQTVIFADSANQSAKLNAESEQQNALAAGARATQTVAAVQAQLAPTAQAMNLQATQVASAINADATRTWNNAQAQAVIKATEMAGQYQIVQTQEKAQGEQNALNASVVKIISIIVGGLLSVFGGIAYRMWHTARTVPATGQAFNLALRSGVPVAIQDGGRVIVFNAAPAPAENQRPTIITFALPAPPIERLFVRDQSAVPAPAQTAREANE